MGRKKLELSWAQRNPERARELRNRDYHKHREKYTKKRREYYENTKEERAAYRKAFYLKHRDRLITEMRAARAKNKDAYKAREANDRLRNKGKYILYGIRRTCRANGLECDLTREWIEERLSKGVCEMSGLPFEITQKRGKNSPSVDRIVPGGPYTVENCRLVLWSVNQALCNYGEDYVLSVFASILKRRGDTPG